MKTKTQNNRRESKLQNLGFRAESPFSTHSSKQLSRALDQSNFCPAACLKAIPSWNSHANLSGKPVRFWKTPDSLAVPQE